MGTGVEGGVWCEERGGRLLSVVTLTSVGGVGWIRYENKREEYTYQLSTNIRKGEGTTCIYLT